MNGFSCVHFQGASDDANAHQNVVNRVNDDQYAMNGANDYNTKSGFNVYAYFPFLPY